jgi:hypothetical protein
MLKQYKNALLEEILKSGYDRSRFDLEGEDECKEGIEVFVTYKGDVTPLAFRLINPVNDFDKFKYSYHRFSPGITYEVSPGFDRDNWFDFDVALKAFRNWLVTDVKAAEDESLVPDLWAQLNQERKSLTLSLSESQKEPFTEEEKIQIRIGLKNFEILISKHFKPKEAELETINESLKYCANALDRLPRFDWAGLLLNTTLQIAITLSLDTTRGRELWGLFQQAFKFVLNLFNAPVNLQ